MATRSTAARLRRTFQYPTDDNDASDSEPEAMDEQGMCMYPNPKHTLQQLD